MQFRQGDVWLKKIKSIPKAVVPVKRDRGAVVLAYGEATGHMHALYEPINKEREAKFFSKKPFVGKVVDWLLRKNEDGHSFKLDDSAELYEKDGVMYLHVKEPAALRHGSLGANTKTADHAPVDLEPGYYEVRRQREYDWFQEETRYVAD